MSERFVDVWFDPSCPLTWNTAQWIWNVADVLPITPRWHIMSLAVLNEHREKDPEGDEEGYLWMPVRICAAVEHHHGQTGLADFYAALGRWLHGDGDVGPETFPGALTEAGLPTELAAAAGSNEYDDAVRRSHAEGIGLVGDHVGTPVVATTYRGRQVAWFGPVLTRVPRGDAAAQLFDAVVTVVGTEGFHEIKTRPVVP
ncbi:MAG TPA: disulfide bond formation protein DsbA [Candidatus Stackebrandtia excrementipullorum]|nr:disulfide bond formation protein DsbA [Candidatus Stackebrandtia excrementipullorum]